MGANFYIFGILVVLVLLGLGFYSWYKKNRDAIQQRMLGWICYQNACNKGYLNPGKYEHDKMALDYAIKYNKKHHWIVID